MNSNTMPTASAPTRAAPCCGCCCDYQRAVIIVDLVIISLEALVLILLESDNANSYVVLIEDDYIINIEIIFCVVSSE